MEIIIRIYDRERLLEAKLQSGETCTIGKAAGCTIQLAAACLGKKTITVKTDADSWSVSRLRVPARRSSRMKNRSFWIRTRISRLRRTRAAQRPPFRCR